jgi:hypothetical protein
MKTNTQNSITLAEIGAAFANHKPDEARAILRESAGASLYVEGKIEKLVRRGELLRMVIQPASAQQLQQQPPKIFADFTDDAERLRIRETKIRKGLMVVVRGNFRTAGEQAAAMDGCRVTVSWQPTDKKRRKRARKRC